MSHRAHLFSLRFGQALREVFQTEGYSRQKFFRDLLAGTTVGIIAIPLAMALAIACGIAPQHGLYTAAIAGMVIALTGGSRYSVSGPTAAYVVVLVPIVQAWGLGGLLLAGLLAGVILTALAVCRLGRFIEYIPESVTLGFTGGIAIVIAALQLKDFLGLDIGDDTPGHFAGKLVQLFAALPTADASNTVIAIATLCAMLVWPRISNRIPPHLPVVTLASIAAWAINQSGGQIDTIASRFSYFASDGSLLAGIPQGLPALQWPWLWPGPDGKPLELSWQLLQALLPAAFAIALLGAIESLLCAMVLDNLSGKRHSANSELLGQGLGNLIVPFFGGISATAALARSAANYKAGATSPIAAVIHGVIVLLAMLVLAPLLGYLPMASLAALLMVVAWNMSEADKSVQLLKTSPNSDRLIWASCLFLTIFFDMVIAISTGILLAAVLFMKDIAALTRVDAVSHPDTPADWKEFSINGPLFFAAADRVFGELSTQCQHPKGLILDLSGVNFLDAGGLSNLIKLCHQCQQDSTGLYLANLQFQPLKTLARVKHLPEISHCQFFADVKIARDSATADSVTAAITDR